MIRPQRIAAAVLSVPLLALPLTVATPADAATRCVITGFSPRTVVVGLTPKVVTFEPQVSDCTVQGWDMDADSFYVYDSNPEEVIEPYDNSQIAAQDVVVSAYNEDYETTNKVFADSFRLKRNTTWDKFNASPEPVRKGSKITVKGRLRVADWTNDRYVGYTNRGIYLEFRTKTGSYRSVKTVKSGSGGYVSTTVTAATDGYWRLRYGGNTIAGGAQTAGDFVDVR